MRVDTSGVRLWDKEYTLIGGGSNLRPSHVFRGDAFPSGGGGASTMAMTGYAETSGMREGFVLALSDAGIVNFGALLQSPGANGPTGSITILHAENVFSNGHAFYVGNYKDASNSNPMAFVCETANSGTVIWTRFLDTSFGNAADGDVATHVIPTTDGGCIVSGAVNRSTSATSAAQSPFAWRLDDNGNTVWQTVYEMSPGTGDTSDQIAGSALLMGQDLWQLVNVNITTPGSGFALVKLDASTGTLDPTGTTYYELDPSYGGSTLAAMSLKQGVFPNDVTVTGFANIETIGSGWSPQNPVTCPSISVNDRPPFSASINVSGAAAPHPMSWLSIYDVPSNGYGGYGSGDEFEAFSNGTQPKWYHPEMGMRLYDLLSPHNFPAALVGLTNRMDPSSGRFDPEHVIFDADGFTQCDHCFPAYLNSPKNPGTVANGAVSNGNFVWTMATFLGDDITANDVACDEECDMNIDFTWNVNCDLVEFTATNSGSTPIADLEFYWDFDLSGTLGDVVLVGDGYAEHEFPPEISSQMVCLTVTCLSSGTTQQVCHFIDPVREDCDCEPCTPLALVNQDHAEGVTYLGGPILTPIFGQVPGCTPGSEGDFTLSLWTFGSPYFPMGSCLDNREVAWQIDGVTVASFGCGDPSDFSGTLPFGDYDVTAILTDCIDPACVDSINRELTLESCTPPDQLPFTLVNAPGYLCPGLFGCGKYLNAQVVLPSCMTLEWIIDGVAMVDDPYVSEMECFAWGTHSVSLRASCNDDPSNFTESAPQTFTCGPVIGPVFEYDLSMCSMIVPLGELSEAISEALLDDPTTGSDELMVYANITSCAGEPIQMVFDSNSWMEDEPVLLLPNASNIQAVSLSIYVGDWFVGIFDLPEIVPPDCSPNEIPGCTDPLALNYDPLATVDDGSCIYPNQNPDPCDSLCDVMVTYEPFAGALWQAPPMVPGDVLFNESGGDVSVDILGPLADTNGDGQVNFDDQMGVEYVEVVASPMPMFFGQGQVLRTANATVKFDIESMLPDVAEVCFEVLDLGGIDNLSINGSAIVITSADLDGDGYMDTPFYGGQETLNGTYLGGVLITATKQPVFNSTGTMVGAKILFRLTGDVNELVLGGQEYWIDDLCIMGSPMEELPPQDLGDALDEYGEDGLLDWMSVSVATDSDVCQAAVSLQLEYGFPAVDSVEFMVVGTETGTVYTTTGLIAVVIIAAVDGDEPDGDGGSETGGIPTVHAATAIEYGLIAALVPVPEMPEVNEVLMLSIGISDSTTVAFFDFPWWDIPWCPIDPPCSITANFLEVPAADCESWLISNSIGANISGTMDVSWEIDGVHAGTGSSLYHAWAGPGMYMVCITVTDSDDPNCTDTFCAPVFVDCGPNEIPGCTDPLALNYDPLATVDDGSCIYPEQNPEPCDSLCDLMVTYEAFGGSMWQAPPMVPGDVLFNESGVEVSVDILGPLMDTDGDFDVDFDDQMGVEYVEVVASPMPAIFGQGKVLRTANATVKFDIDAALPNVDEVCFEILDLGGIDNIAINGSPIVITSADLDGDGVMDTPFYGGQEVLNASMLGGVFVTATKTSFPGGAKILFRLMGDVNELVIGGQEYWIDDLCITSTQVVEPLAGCTDPQACNYNPEANEDDDSCYYAEPGYDCEGYCLFDEDEDGVCDQWEIVGCQDQSACNFVAAATEAGYCDYPEEGYNCDGTCTSDVDGDGICDQDELPGCTDPDAMNYYPLATDEDGSCMYDNSCPTDIDGDNQTSVTDLLLLLSAYASTCE